MSVVHEGLRPLEVGTERGEKASLRINGVLQSFTYPPISGRRLSELFYIWSVDELQALHGLLTAHVVL